MTIKIFLPFLVVLMASCHLKHKLAELKSMNEGHMEAAHFLFSIPYDNSSDSAAIIYVNINGKKRRFMIDTGAPLSISVALQAELKCPIAFKTTLRDSNGDTSGIEIVRVPELSIGDIKFREVPALVMDLAQPVFLCDSIDGLIGSNLLRSLAIQFNKPEQRIYFADNADSFAITGKSIMTSMRLDEAQSNPIIAVRINGLMTDSTLYDTGDKTLYTVSNLMLDSFSGKPEMNVSILATGKGTSGQGVVARFNNDFITRLARIDSINIGTRDIQNIYTEPTPDNISRMGRGLWNYGLVTLDYPGKNFYFTPFREKQVAATPGGFGFKYQERNNKLLVTVVWNNSSAFALGLRPGDEILKFGNFIPANISRCDWEASCAHEAASPQLQLEYRTASGKTHECQLKRYDFDNAGLRDCSFAPTNTAGKNFSRQPLRNHQKSNQSTKKNHENNLPSDPVLLFDPGSFSGQ
ncbi:MAG TPA: aspartyl protease family protein [Chryseolinea sp.]|nr:aspartyl protease family protein [Chryseolinea sp.]